MSDKRIHPPQLASLPGAFAMILETPGYPETRRVQKQNQINPFYAFAIHPL